MAKRKTQKQRERARKKRKRAVKRVLKRIKRVTSGLAIGWSSTKSLQASIKSIGKSIGKTIEYKLDEPRRDAAKQINAIKRQMRAQAKWYENQAAALERYNQEHNVTGKSADAQVQAFRDAAGTLFNSVGQIYSPKKMELDNLPDLLQAATNAQEQVNALELARRSDFLFRYEARMARDKKKTPLFGKGDVGYAKMVAFFNYYKRDYQAAPTMDRLAAIQAAHPGMTLAALYEKAMETKHGGKSFQEFVADYLSIPYTVEDTTDPTWLGQMDDEFAALSSPEQNEIMSMWAKYSA